ncbi:MAG: hypothetical protein ACI4TW_00745, partial [Prevotella sp.]
MKRIVRTGALLNVLLAVFHIASLYCLDTMFEVYGIDAMMNRLAQYGDGLPFVVAVGVSLLFLAAACYGLSATGDIPRLPLQKTAFWVMLVVFFGRSAWGIAVLSDHFSWLEFSSTAVALPLGA